ncbi:TonB family protein [Hyphococcus sp. DH-69]|uniref:TonB family protein n=1 Tax=Hyphococcus formosus TaxID=3143534 RepID=UPI00398AF47A
MVTSRANFAMLALPGFNLNEANLSMANGSAKIVDMADARARLGGGEVANVGVRLAMARESRGISLNEVATRIHIREAHLQAIENVDKSALPARPYALGFVRTYAEFLELDARATVEQFKQDAGYDAPAPIETEKFSPAEQTTDAEPNQMSLPAVMAILVFVLWCLWQLSLPREVTELGSSDTPQIAKKLEVEAPTPTQVIGELVEATIVEDIAPVYPRSCTASAQPIETVDVAFTVTANGRIAGERIANSTNDCFNDAALNAIRRWQFNPRTVDGVAKPAYDQSYSFQFARP